MTAPKTATFDLADVFTGKAFPKDTKDVYLDEETSYEISRLNKESTKAVALNDEDAAKRIEAEFTALIAKAEKSHYVVYLTGVSRQDRKTALEEVMDKYPMESDAFGRIKPNEKANDFLANLSWKMHIEKIVDPNGAELVPSLEDIIIFRDNAPDPAIAVIEEGINELSEGVKSGFETIVQNSAFLSKR